MPFVKGQPRPANAGRRAGTPNKITREVAQQLADLKCNPVEGLAKLADDKTTPVAIRARCYAELLEYCKPKLSRHEVVGPAADDGTPGALRLVVQYVDKPVPEPA